MDNKIILKTLIEKLKMDSQFGKLSAIELHGINGSKAEITLQLDNATEAYSLMVVKKAV